MGVGCLGNCDLMACGYIREWIAHNDALYIPNDLIKVIGSFCCRVMREYSWDEIRKYNHEKALWVVIYGVVYDLTHFQFDHPGGPDVLQDTVRFGQGMNKRYYKCKKIIDGI